MQLRRTCHTFYYIAQHTDTDLHCVSILIMSSSSTLCSINRRWTCTSTTTYLTYNDALICYHAHYQPHHSSTYTETSGKPCGTRSFTSLILTCISWCSNAKQ